MPPLLLAQTQRFWSSLYGFAPSRTSCRCLQSMHMKCIDPLVLKTVSHSNDVFKKLGKPCLCHLTRCHQKFPVPDPAKSRHISGNGHVVWWIREDHLSLLRPE
jgi:hypothetical protein